MENKYLKASCPVCGRSLFRGAEGSQLDGYCPKCGKHLKINYVKDGVSAEVMAAYPQNKIEKNKNLSQR